MLRLPRQAFPPGYFARSESSPYRRRNTGSVYTLDAETADVLWETLLSALYPAFQSATAGGKQYVPVATGMPPEANGLCRMTPGIDTGTDTILQVFALP